MKIKKRFVAAGVVAAVAVLAGSTFFWRQSILKSMTPAETSETPGGIFVLRNDYVNAFLVTAGTDDGTLIAFDAGLGAPAIEKEVHSLGLLPEKVRYLFLTHTDYDHVDGAGAYRNATVFMLDGETEMLNRSTSRAPFMKNRFDRPFTTLRDGDSVCIGNRIVRIRAVTGHTRGHAVYILDGAYLFSGDALKVKNGRASVFTPAFNMDTPLLRREIRKIGQLEHIKTVFTAHYGVFSAVDTLLAELR